jgi:hypothetical protein
MARKKKEEVKLGIYSGTVDDIFKKLLEDPEIKKMKKKFDYTEHLYDRKFQGAVYTYNNKGDITDEVTVNVGSDQGPTGISLDRYHDDFLYAYTEPKDLDETIEHIKYFIKNHKLPDEIIT